MEIQLEVRSSAPCRAQVKSPFYAIDVKDVINCF